MKTYAINRKAYHDYDILEEYEAGLELKGPEVKAIRDGGVELKGAFALARGRELVVEGMRSAYAAHRHQPVLLSALRREQPSSTLPPRGFRRRALRAGPAGHS